jgi:hypothetical protein
VNRQGLLDTSTLLLLGRITATSTLPPEPLISIVTIAELSVGPLVATSEPERAARQAHLQQAEADFDPLVFDAGAARRLPPRSGAPGANRQRARSTR